MREPPSDRVRDAFADLTDSVDPWLRPPGVTSVRETVRRRRQRRLGGATAAVLAVAGVVALVRLPLMEQPALNMADPPTAGVTTTPSGVLRSPLAPPAAAPTAATATPPPFAHEDSAPERTSPPTRSAGAALPPPPCITRVTAAVTGSELVIAAGPFCSGDEIVVSWATYETQRDGSQKLFASERHTLTEREPRVTTRLRESPTCVGPWYALRSDPPIPTTIAAGVVEPFPSGAVLARQDGEICLS